MEISAQAIQTVGGQSGPIQAIIAGLKPGDSLTAQILARTQGGRALVALAGKQVQMPLPSTLAPGTVLTLTVQQGSDGLQFIVIPQNAAGQAAVARPSVSPGTSSTTQATPGAGSAATTGTASASSASGASGQTTPSSGAAVSTPSAATVRVASAPPLPSSSNPALLPPLVNARTGIPVPAPQGMVSGGTLAAQILSTPTASTAIISLGAQELPVSLPQPAAAGTLLPLVVQAGPDGLQLAHAPSSTLSGFSAPVSGQVLAAPTQAGQAPAADTASPVTATTHSGAQNPAAAPVQTPAAVLSQATLASLGNQNSIATLLASVLKLGNRMRELPDEVQRVTQRLTQTMLPLEGKSPNVQALQRAVRQSGIFLESQLAQGAGGNAIEGDVKTLLLVLRRALGDWLGAEVKPAVLAGKPPPPPQPGAAPRMPAQAASAPLSDDMPIEDIGKSLLSQTDAALSRLRLHQIVSLPDRPETLASGRQAIHLEVPVSLGEQPSVLSLVVTRDGKGDTPDQGEKNWRVQFAVNASVIGEVGAEVGLLAGRTNVVLSAAEPDTVEALTKDIDTLSGALEAVDLTPGILRVRRIGAPQPQTVSSSSPAGHYLDRDT